MKPKQERLISYRRSGKLISLFVTEYPADYLGNIYPHLTLRHGGEIVESIHLPEAYQQGICLLVASLSDLEKTRPDIGEALSEIECRIDEVGLNSRLMPDEDARALA